MMTGVDNTLRRPTPCCTFVERREERSASTLEVDVQPETSSLRQIRSGQGFDTSSASAASRTSSPQSSSEQLNVSVQSSAPPTAFNEWSNLAARVGVLERENEFMRRENEFRRRENEFMRKENESMRQANVDKLCHIQNNKIAILEAQGMAQMLQISKLDQQLAILLADRDDHKKRIETLENDTVPKVKMIVDWFKRKGEGL
ncbi:hypothetical protein BT69DRAFT_1347522 [Atractiella rhizophila]|nr:hypothetical protein BT69DRAFT_1347522 [Atractiella rhizophila]